MNSPQSAELLGLSGGFIRSFSSHLVKLGRRAAVVSLVTLVFSAWCCSCLADFLLNIHALPDDTAATITWDTVAPATAQVRYGLSNNLVLASPIISTLSTNHAVLLTNLIPGTAYSFIAMSSDGLVQYTSSILPFVTSNYTTSAMVFDISQVWRFSTTNLDGVAWTARDYDDSAWQGQGPGTLWADSRFNSPPDYLVQPRTMMPLNPATGYPFITYYFRTHFDLPAPPIGVSLQSSAYVDDGAVFYLNGTEIYRVGMAPVGTPVYNQDFAWSYYCSSGNATCPIDFPVAGDATTNLLAAGNVLAVEVHNYAAVSPDITFGMLLDATLPIAAPAPQLSLFLSNGAPVLSWTRGGFILQWGDSPQGPWADVPGPVVSSPFTADNTASARFFRLRR